MTGSDTSETIVLENEAYAYRKLYDSDELDEAWQRWRKQKEKAHEEESPQRCSLEPHNLD